MANTVLIPLRYGYRAVADGPPTTENLRFTSRDLRRLEGMCMASVVSALGKDAAAKPLDPALATASELLTSIVEEKAYVGEVYSLGYEDALVQIHDFHRQQVGGIPALSFLIATRVQPGRSADVREEDASLILLRVLDKCDLPDAAEALRVRVETAKRVSGEVERFWDHKEVMDAHTAQLLGYAGVKCRVLGTFYVNDFGTEGKPDYRLTFGSDLSNYYPNRGLKVFKPIYVRTDHREVTLKITTDVLAEVFPSKRMFRRHRPIDKPTQTHLFRNKIDKSAEVDLVMLPAA